MTRDDQTERKGALAVLGLLGLCVLLLFVAVWLALPLMGDFVAETFTPGLDLKEAAIASFFVTVVTLVVFAVAAGDGLIGEIQFMLGGFAAFFVVCWLMLAWIF